MHVEMLVLVDNNDQQIGLAEKIYAHEHGLLHRAFSVFIVREHNNEIEILLQQRNNNKYHCGSLWTNTCCSHPRDNEDIVIAGERRLYEEMGLKIKLSKLGSFIYRAEFGNGLIENEYDHVLLGYYNNENIAINVDEVQDYKWFSMRLLQQQLLIEPELYTPWLSQALNIVQKHMEQK